MYVCVYVCYACTIAIEGGFEDCVWTQRKHVIDRCMQYDEPAFARLIG